MSHGDSVTKLLVIGPTPPPYHGVAVMTRSIVEAVDGLGLLAGHLDTRDERPVETIGRLDVTNLLLGVRHALELHRMLRTRPSAGVLLPISQGTWGFLRDAVFVLVTHLHRRRLVIQLHGGALAEFCRRSNAPMQWLIRAVFRRADQAWALTPVLRAQFDGLVPERRVRCVANIVEDTLVREPVELPRGRPEPDRFRVLFLSNLLPEKGCFDVVAAVRLLGHRSGGWEVRLAGRAEPKVAERLRQEITALPSGGASVTLVGPITGDAKEIEYRWADVFLYPTRLPEGQPLVLLEAMAAGLPIITTPEGGIPDTVRDNLEGLLVPQRDVDGISRALLSLASDVGLRRSLGRAARVRYEDCYRPERLQRDLATLFHC